MNEKQKRLNPAKRWLMRYQDAKYQRRRLLASGPEAREVHNADMLKLEKIMQDVLDMISSLDNEHQRDVLMMRYIDGYPWPRVIMEMQDKGYCESMSYTMHGRALQHVAEKLQQMNSKTKQY